MYRSARPVPPGLICALAFLLASCGGGEDRVAPSPVAPPVPTTVTVSPPVVTLRSLGETVRLTATVRDQRGQSMTGVTVTWATSEASVASVTSDGLVTASGNGTATVSGAVAGLSADADVTVEQRPARLRALSGNHQEGISGHPLPQPLVARIEDEGGSGVPGVAVSFSPGEASGSVSLDRAVTDTDGQTSTEWTLGNGRIQSVAVSAAGELATEFSATLISGPYECGTATQPANVVDLPLRAIHASGYWGTNGQVVEEWTRSGAGPLVPRDYVDWLKSLHVNWVGISVPLYIDDSMDSSVERVGVGDGPWPDAAVRQFIRDMRAEDIDVYMTLAIHDHEAATSARPVRRWQLGDSGDPGQGVLPEHWPWRPDHPEHERFVADFWESYADQAVHFAGIAQEEGARLFSLGTETDRLFRTRPGGYNTATDFGEELQSMVDRVRAVYDGLLTYDMHYDVLKSPDFYGPGSFCLWEDLTLDMIGISAWFDLVDAPPSSVMSVASLETAYDRIFREYLVPLANDNPGRPIVFLEYGAMDVVTAPHNPADASEQGTPFVFVDANGNGMDDGRETQANIYQAVLNTMEAYPAVVDGLFLWDNWMASDELWSEGWANFRNFDIRDKPSGEVVRSAYRSYRR